MPPVDSLVKVSLLVADSYPNFSICGIPYYVSGEVSDWRDLAHRGVDDLEALGIDLLLDHRVTELHLNGNSLRFAHSGNGRSGTLDYDRLVIATDVSAFNHDPSVCDGLAWRSAHLGRATRSVMSY